MRLLAFRFYDGCPVGCDHCSISAPTDIPRRNKISISDVLALADYVSSRGGPKLAFLTGSELSVGEPEFKELAAELVMDRQFVLAVITSGFWAGSARGLDRGIRYLFECSVSHIQLSVDHYHRRALSLKQVDALVDTLIREGFGVSINETVSLGAESTARTIPSISKLPEMRRLCFTRSSVGRALSETPPAKDKITSPFHECDFGKVLYLHPDRQIYFCSGPGSMTPSRSIATLGMNGIEFDEQRLDTIKHVVEKLASQNPPCSSDGCAKCTHYFQNQADQMVPLTVQRHL